MEGHLTLIDIEIPETGLHSSLDNPDQLYAGVQGTFCHISWDLQKDRPSKYPTFHHLQQSSFLCPGTLLTADLWQVARQAEPYDFRNNTSFAATQPREKQLPVPPTLTIFHESKCGSTVLANALAAFAPRHTRVYADAPAVTKSLRACGSGDSDNNNDNDNPSCDSVAQRKLIQDVFYLLGRVSRPVLPQYVFYKVDSAAAQNVHAFVQAMPQAPWLFAYRDSTEILMSHFHHYQLRQNVPWNYQPACLEGYNNNGGADNAAVVEIVHSHNRTLDSLTREEYCAAHVASLGVSVLRQHHRTAHQTGGSAALQPQAQAKEHHPLDRVGPLHAVDQTPHWLVNYRSDVPHVLWETVLPELIVGVLRPEEKERMKAAARAYAHGGEDGDDDDNHFRGDSTMKRGRAPPSVQQAVALFLDPIYQQLEAVREELDNTHHKLL